MAMTYQKLFDLQNLEESRVDGSSWDKTLLKSREILYTLNGEGP